MSKSVAKESSFERVCMLPLVSSTQHYRQAYIESQNSRIIATTQCPDRDEQVV